jgi:hypothetical protein
MYLDILPGNDSVQSGRWLQAFQGNFIPPSENADDNNHLPDFKAYLRKQQSFSN